MKHKHIGRKLFFFAVVLLLSSCDRQGELSELSDTAVPLKVFAEIEDDGVATRADKVSFFSGDAIGITGNGGKSVNVEYIYNGTGWYAASSLAYCTSNDVSERFTAYYKYDSKYDDGTITINTTDGGGYWDDFLVARANNMADYRIKFSFVHYMSKLTVRVSSERPLVEFSMSGPKNQGVLDMKTGELALTSTDSIYFPTSSSVFDVYLLPQKLSQMLLYFTIELPESDTAADDGSESTTEEEDAISATADDDSESATDDEPASTTVRTAKCRTLLDVPDGEFVSGCNYLVSVTIK